MVEPIAIPRDDLPLIDLRYEFRRRVAVRADPQVLNYPYRRAWARTDQSECNRQLLAVVAQHPLFQPLLDVENHLRRVHNVPGLTQFLIDLAQHRVHLFAPRVHPVPYEELVHDAFDLYRATTGDFLHALIVQSRANPCDIVPSPNARIDV
ncbi:hypothetical protein QJS04_geneDACA005624 [Acorus gramineus]|uniref:Uncharacterized protein n=1 Tax=Acorus gramineus TaxID=55184 RepID=A0AAV9A4Q3_ACOGR|nr:hypothetical protein QJS04_geneDACA005624 [Acorus gramineus]